MTPCEKIPSEAECYKLIEEYKMLPNIIEHSKQVRNVSLKITDNLADPSLINRDLVNAGALLHDIAKTRSINSGELRHDSIGADMMRELGYESIAIIIESHVIFHGFKPEGPLEVREIVFYADKRVMHDRVVSVAERVDDLVNRYGKTDEIKEMIIQNKKFILAMEAKIQKFLIVDMELITSSPLL
ncbi:MAG: HDIG domain-containing protein [bacterium]|nr:HDIG domain-containing protein [bacterium]